MPTSKERNDEVAARNATSVDNTEGDEPRLEATDVRGKDAEDALDGNTDNERLFGTDEVTPPETPAPRGLWSQPSSYFIALRDFFASSVGQIVTSYTLDSAAISADANGDKIVYEGTVLQASGSKVKPHTSGTAVGVCSQRVNARDGDQDIGMVVGGRLRSDKMWDNGTFGTVVSGAVTDLAAIGIRLVTYDQ